MAGELGKASLDLEANLGPFERHMAAADATSDRLKDKLEALASVGDAAQSVLNDIKMSQGQGARSRVAAEEIISGVHGISDEAREAALTLDRVHLSQAQAAETEAAGAVIDHELENIHDKANRARRALDGVKLRLAHAAGGAGGVFGGRPGVGPFGAGYGRLGALGTLIGVGALTAPAAGPAAIGLLAGIPTMAAAGAGAIGVLALAFSGLGKAIGGDKKAYDALTASQKSFVDTVRSLDGFLKRLKQIAGQSLFPGLTKGLKAALSPGTVNAIETALVQLGHALGSAGAAWGKYFGSPRFQQIFGPLMQSAARTIGVLSDAFLHLFDALGVLARAAIPFTNWLTDSIDKGARFADTWLRARDATGQLGGAMREARVSLTIVAKLFGSLLNLTYQLGAALYPVAKVAVKALTDGLNGLAGIIHRNQTVIREIVGAFITGLKAAIEAVVFAVNKLVGALSYFVGPEKARLIIAIGAIGLALALSLGPESAVIVGAIAAVGLIVHHWTTIKRFFINLGHEIINAFKYVWYELKVNAIKAALAVVEPFSHLPGFMGHWARVAKDKMQGQLDKIHPPNMDWGGYAAEAGLATGIAWKKGFFRGIAGAITQAIDAVTGTISRLHVPKKTKHPPKPGTHAWYMQNLGYDPTTEPTYGKPGPFTKNTGGGGGTASVIPASASHLLDLASQQASIASTTHNARKERRALEREIADLEKALNILLAKWRKAHGKVKTELFHAITRVRNEIRSAQKKLRDMPSPAEAKLDYALDQAKVAVEKAQEGSKAWDRAIAAEEKALQAEIRYWDRRAHNDKLSAAARDHALKEELKYQKQLKALLDQTKQAANANIGEFLSTFIAIQNTFGPNAFPVDPGDSGSGAGSGGGPSGGQPPKGGHTGGKTDTHLHEMKNEQRQTNRHLAAIRDQGRFPGSAAAAGAGMAVGA